MKITIKQANIQDLDNLMKWRMIVLHDVFSIPLSESMEKLEKQNRIYYQKALPTEDHIACFAYVDNKIVGCGGVCIYQEMPSPDNSSGDCAYLMNIYTCPEYRKNGIGKKVVSWLVEQAKKKNITKIYLETSESGRYLYQKMGFTDMCDYMHIL